MLRFVDNVVFIALEFPIETAFGNDHWVTLPAWYLAPGRLHGTSLKHILQRRRHSPRTALSTALDGVVRHQTPLPGACRTAA